MKGEKGKKGKRGGRGNKGEDEEGTLEEPGAKGTLCEGYRVHSSSLVTKVMSAVH